jgi:hypothetical protein
VFSEGAGGRLVALGLHCDQHAVTQALQHEPDDAADSAVRFPQGPTLMTRYAICRTDASPCQGWFWAGAGCWTKVVRHARTFEFMSDAELNGIAKCPFPLQEWDVVAVESQAAE